MGKEIARYYRAFSVQYGISLNLPGWEHPDAGWTAEYDAVRARCRPGRGAPGAAGRLVEC